MAARAISGTRRTFKELVDGTLRVQIDVDPDCRTDFLRIFSEIDARVALAPIKPPKAQPEAKDEAEVALKGGELAKLAGILCNDPAFQVWLDGAFPDVHEHAPAALEGAELAAYIVRTVCCVESRAHLDHDHRAAVLFHQSIRKPWSDRK